MRWVGLGPTEDQWRNYDDINTGGVNDQWTEYERARRADNLVHNRVSLVTDDSTSMEEIAASTGLQPDQQLKVLVLFSGTGSVEQALHKCFPNVISQ